LGTKARLRFGAASVILLVLAVLGGIPCRAQSANEYFDEGSGPQACTAQNRQPNWVSPLVTSTGRLINGVRDDTFFEEGVSGGGSVTEYGGMKGVTFIVPHHHDFGIRIGLPSYIVHHDSSAANGFDDIPVRLKYRLRSRNQCGGNYVLTLFFNGSGALSRSGAGRGHGSYGPTVAFGKGWRPFDIQSTLGATIPVGSVDSATGTFVGLNSALQYRAGKGFWPEVEVNSTWWLNGKNRTKKQTFLTPGLVKKISIRNRATLTLGAGVQIAATHYHAYNHKVILSARMPF
jgi:hypothetical protein